MGKRYSQHTGFVRGGRSTKRGNGYRQQTVFVRGARPTKRSNGSPSTNGIRARRPTKRATDSPSTNGIRAGRPVDQAGQRLTVNKRHSCGRPVDQTGKRTHRQRTAFLPAVVTNGGTAHRQHTAFRGPEGLASFSHIPIWDTGHIVFKDGRTTASSHERAVSCVVFWLCCWCSA
jgi:hypothetical protein